MERVWRARGWASVMLPRSKSLVLVALIVSAAVLLVAGYYSYSSVRLFTEAREQTARSKQTLLELERTVSTLLDAETGQRGYLLTGKDAYLNPYHEAVNEIRGQLAALAPLMAGNAAATRNFSELQTASQAKLNELAQTIRLYDAGERAAALRLVMTDAGKMSMDRVRLIADRIAADQAMIYALNMQSELRARRLSLLSTWATAVLAIALLGLLYLIVRRDAAQIRASETQLAITLQSIGDAVISTDAAGRIVLMNPVAESLTGWSVSAARGLPLESVFHIVNEESRAQVESPVAKVLRAGVVVGLANHTLLMRRDGSELPIADSGAPVLNASNETVGVVLVFRDASPERELERAMKDAERRKDEFLATLSHELRNPLAPIRQAVAVIRAPSATEAQVRWSVDVIERQVHNMARLLDDLLDVSRITRGTLQVRKDLVRLRSVLDAAIELARPTIDGKHHVLAVDCPLDPAFHADPLRLAQVIGNLLTNAAKYTDPHGRITVAAHQEAEEIVIAVKDTGAGITAEMLTKIFEMFVQADSAKDRADGGLGIGLALSRGLAELHGGTLEARSDGLGRGSEFVLRVPANHADSPARAASGDAAPESPPRVSRFVVADDNVDAADSMAMLLRMQGHEVQVAHDGEAAWKALEAFQPEFALIDVGMPRLNGLQVAALTRAAPWARATTLVALTGWGQEGDRQAALAAGFHYHFVKPVDVDSLLRVLFSSAPSSAAWN